MVLVTVDRKTRHRQSKRQRGLCGWDGCAVQTGRAWYYCPEHRAAERARKKAKRISQLPPEEAEEVRSRYLDTGKHF